MRRFRTDPWIEPVGNATVLDVEIREPSTRHVITLSAERWLAGAPTNPNEAVKAQLKNLLVQTCARPSEGMFDEPLARGTCAFDNQ